MTMGIRCERANSTVFGVELVNNRADGPCRKQIPPDRGSGNFPSDGGVSESTTTRPIGEALVLRSAAREGAAFVPSITLVVGSIIA